jgi:hypothetical protein
MPNPESVINRMLAGVIISEHHGAQLPPVACACGPEPSQEVAGLRVLVAVEHVQVCRAHQRQQLAHAGLASACLANKQHRLLVAQTPAGQRSDGRNVRETAGDQDQNHSVERHTGMLHVAEGTRQPEEYMRIVWCGEATIR